LKRLLELGYNTFADILLVYIGILIAAHAYSYLTRMQQQELARSRLHQLLAQSELQALRAQFQPHFLFNALQGISTLVETSPSTAQTMLHTLAALLRAVLKHDSSDLVSFREEIAIIRAYLDLEQMRLGNRLTVRWRIAPEVDASLIPQLILQPLVENAILHGVAPAQDGGWISIEAYLQDDRLLVEIRNSVAESSQCGMRVGLANLRARLAHLYGDDAEFNFRLLADGDTAVARLAVPAFAKSAECFPLASSFQ
jgi:LytS/YehU family sensor histidine kinase